ncbi:hypothetical protein [Sphingomonas kyeonggiensis]|uniref:EF-hand domain-containing protein n=1 Tax=Sphingomonas kyeonggiensis TaxID=1268553 RepID=A0A7W6NVE1_9SPHN|nr:hypothetical protein [Sphingomonas kyeonggiensis]MBB4097357.1 hypothetical protein [Sphingomonas kyeonggiensis]
MNHRLQLVAATLAGVLVTVAAGGIAFASMDHGMRMGPFARADANGDGVVTRAEWIAAANARFDKFDTNKDGKLVVGEVPPAPSRDFAPRHGPHGFDGPEDGPPAPEQSQPGNAN